jgi:GntR family transcriptional repressor for pyruvate dehydrogenase complex
MSNTKELFLDTIPRQRLSDQIVRRLENLILNKELKLGDALPPERELAARLGVSRNILREAISTMIQKGLLEVRQGAGTFVACPSAELLSDSLTIFVRLNDSGFYDLLEARLALEVEIAELAARRCTDEDIRLISERFTELEAAADDPERYVETDVLFHTALAEAARNEVLQLLLDSIRGATRENIRVLVEQHKQAVTDAMRYHRRILKAIQQRSPEHARNAMREHLESVRRGIQELEAREEK